MKFIVSNCLYFLLFSFIKLHAQQPKLIQPSGHTGGIDMVEYSPDGKYILTGSRSIDDRIVRMWEVKSGKLIFNLDKHSNRVFKIAFSPDGKYIMTLAGFPLLWNAGTGELITILDSVATSDVVFSPDTRYIAYARRNVEGIFLWDISSAKNAREIAPGNEYDDIAFSPDGKQILTYAYFAAGTTDSSAIGVWDVATGKKTFEYKCPVGSFNRACFSKNKDWMAVNTSGGIFLFNLISKKRITIEEGIEWTDTDNAVFSGDDGQLIFSAKSYIYVWDIAKEKLIYDPLSGNAWIAGTGIVGDSSIVAVDHDGFFHAWDLKTGVKKIEGIANQGSASGFILSPDKKHFASSSYNNTVNIWSLDDNSFERTLKGAGSGLMMVQFSPDSTKIVSVDNNYTIRITDISSGKLLQTITGHGREIAEMHISPDGRRILTSSYDSTLRMWDSETGLQLYAVNAESVHFYKMAIHPSGRSFVTWEAVDDKLTIRDLESGKEKKVQKLVSTGHTANSMVYTPDGKYLLVSEKGSVQVRHAETGDLLKTLPGGKENITQVSISNDSKWAAAVADSMILAWDIAGGKKITNMKGIPPAYYSRSGEAAVHVSVNFSPDNKKIIVASDDATAKIIDIATGRQIMTLDSVHYLSLLDAYYTNDGKKILTTGRDGYIIAWDALTGQPETGLGSYTEDIIAADIHPNSKYIVTATGSNLNLYTIEDGDLLYKTLFVEDKDWLVVDSSERYDGTEAARKLLYFTCNNEIIELDQLKDQLWVPDLAARITKGETLTSKTLKELDICGLTPQIENRSGAAGYRFIITPRRGGLGETSLMVNGIEIRRYTPNQLTKKDSLYELVLARDELKDFFVAGQENNVSVKAFTSGNTISSRGLIINEESSKTSSAPPDFYAVMVGVSDYKGDELDLKYAAKDATDLSKAIMNAARKLLNTDSKEHVFVYNLTTNADHYLLPEKKNIQKTLEEIGKKATANDILMIFFAGHGVMEGDKKQFYFLTADASKATAAEAVTDVGISTAELTEWMKPQNIKAQKRILIFDACNSGQAIKDFVKLGTGDQDYLAARNDDKAQQVKAIDKLNEKSGLFILSASASNQSAYEMGRYSQGLLTYSLLKAIKQDPDILENGKFLNLSRWFNAAERTVTELSKESGARQEPQIVTNTNFNIGLVDESVIAGIILPAEKPLFAASNFQNSDEAIADDDLELSKLFNLQLSDMAGRGAESRIVYVTATNSPDAYSLSGRYTVKGNTITVTVNIKQNKIIRSKFESTGTKDKLNELAAAITAKAAEMVK